MDTSQRSPEGQLVRSRTPDGLELEGFLVEPDGADNGTVLLHLHGMFENFHLPLFVDPLARHIKDSGATFLTVNTRAQDYYLYFRKWLNGSFEWELWGGSYEIFDKCLLDISGWMDFCSEQLGKRIVLMGHSHGALKAAYYAAKAADARLVALVLISPSDDVGLQKRNLGSRYDEALKLANQRLQEGNGRELLPKWMYGQPISAEMYVDMYAPDSELALFTFSEPGASNGLVSEITLPTLVVFGSDDKATSVVDSHQALRLCEQALVRAARFTGRVVEGGDHQYKGKEDQLATTVIEWAKATLPAHDR